uniref:Uncharacterized protein n=1 Tax=Oryza brachyantha TaxID=4533 RepID=J3MCG2_ORYBR
LTCCPFALLFYLHLPAICMQTTIVLPYQTLSLLPPLIGISSRHGCTNTLNTPALAARGWQHVPCFL